MQEYFPLWGRPALHGRDSVIWKESLWLITLVRKFFWINLVIHYDQNDYNNSDSYFDYQHTYLCLLLLFIIIAIIIVITIIGTVTWFQNYHRNSYVSQNNSNHSEHGQLDVASDFSGSVEQRRRRRATTIITTHESDWDIVIRGFPSQREFPNNQWTATKDPGIFNGRRDPEDHWSWRRGVPVETGHRLGELIIQSLHQFL